MIATLDRLQDLNPEPKPLYSAEIEPKLIGVLLDEESKHEIPIRELKQDWFTDPACSHIIAKIHDLHERFGDWTRATVKNELAAILTQDDPWEQVFAVIDAKIKPMETAYVLAEWRKWTAERHRFQCELKIACAVQQEQWDAVVTFIDELKAGPTGTPQEAKPFGIVSLTDLLVENQEPHWYIENVLEANEPYLVGGKKKTLKTAFLCDMAISLATGTPFLGHFAVPQARRVLFISAESGQRDIAARCQAIMGAKGIKEPPPLLEIGFDAPRLSNETDLALISAYVKNQRVEVVMIDPLYLTLLDGNKTASGSDLYSMGPVFRNVARACLANGATPILAHHFKKSAGDELDLDDFTFTGAAEFARQSLLLGRRGEYSDPRNNQLRARTHGFGRGQRYSIQVDEGMRESPEWRVTVETESETACRAVRDKTEQAVAELRNALQELGDEFGDRHITKYAIKAAVGRWSTTKLNQVLSQAIAEGFVEAYQHGSRTCYRRIM